VATRHSSIPPINSPHKVSFERLTFDTSNPRLMTGDDWSVFDDVSIISAYREIAALDELVLSIATNKYINFEPLIIHGADGGPYTVLEGNRRLAAMKILSDPALAKACRVSIPSTISQEVLDSFNEVLVIRVKDRKDAETFIGFKHINGPHRWDAYAKARFVTDWYKRDKDSGITIASIAKQTGDTNDTIKSYIGAIFVLEQAENSGQFEIENRSNKGRFAFSHLYTALNRSEYRNFLGLQMGWNNAPSDAPITDKKLDHLGEVLRYIYGSKRDKIEPLVQSQNPHLAQLGRSLTSERALLRLRAGESLTVAFSEVEGGNLFNQSLGELMASAEKALTLSSKFDGNRDLVYLIEEIKLKVNQIESAMKQKAHIETPK
jgi:hypothetical protein